MKAVEAKKIADDFNKIETDNQYANIMKAIDAECKIGRYEFTYDGDLRAENKKKLEANGFKVGKPYDDRDGYTTTKISWS